MKVKIVHKNKKAFFDYEILERLEAGIVLSGAEVKSVKNGQITLRDAFVRIEDGEAYLWNADISRYKYSSQFKDYDPKARRKLLLKKRQIEYLEAKQKSSKLTIVPLKVYLKHGLVKIEIALVRGKKRHEKKNKIKERDLDRQLHREKRKYMVK